VNDASPRLSVILITWREREAIERTIPALLEQFEEGDELVISDNASEDGSVGAVAKLAPDATVVRNGANLGFTGGCNAGAAAASGDLLLFLNPDAVPQPGFVEAIKRPMRSGNGGGGHRWGAWMGLVTSEGGRIINTDGNEIHFTGICWAGGDGRPISEVPQAPREVPYLSGACLAVPREVWDRYGGFPPSFFIYHEDVDISLRVRLEGGHVGIEPDAVVDHDYEFTKGAAKWRRLERNRWSVIVRNYPTKLLLLLLPALLLTELALIPISIAGGWGRQKLLAMWDTIRALPRLVRERHEIQARRQISDAEFAAWLTPDLDSRYLGRAAESPVLRRGLRAYWSGVRALLG
jgi:GT2 family glycosyltransferase